MFPAFQILEKPMVQALNSPQITKINLNYALEPYGCLDPRKPTWRRNCCLVAKTEHLFTKCGQVYVFATIGLLLVS